ncbi:hypothetical protein EC968_004956 [Mortierella alpina]|nr:hypothetical protein EC968_004956 [Mortierella alpina]
MYFSKAVILLVGAALLVSAKPVELHERQVADVSVSGAADVSVSDDADIDDLDDVNAEWAHSGTCQPSIGRLCAKKGYRCFLPPGSMPGAKGECWKKSVCQPSIGLGCEDGYQCYIKSDKPIGARGRCVPDRCQPSARLNCAKGFRCFISPGSDFGAAGKCYPKDVCQPSIGLNCEDGQVCDADIPGGKGKCCDRD